MSTTITTPEGVELFAENHGERRLPWSLMVETPSETVAAFQLALQQYFDEHPRLEVVMLDHKAADELVIRWRWRKR